MNCIVPPACAKPLGRYLQAGDSAVDNDSRLDDFVVRQNITENNKQQKCVRQFRK
jgi:hypothetical protein